MKQRRTWPGVSFAGGLLPVLLLLASTIALLYKTAVGNLIMAGLDVFTYFYPYKAYAAEAIRAGSLPLWNPYLFMGAPFLANIQSAVLYPLNLPLYWLPVPKMITWSAVLHLFLAGAFAYLLARRALGYTIWGAVTAGLTLALGGFLSAQVEHINQLNVLVWLPLLLFLFHRSYAGRRTIYPVLTSLVIGLQFLAGHTQSSYINLAALGCYAVYLPLAECSGHSRSARSVARSVGLLVLVVVLGLALAACQLLPTYELSTLSVRSGGLPYRQAVSFSLRPGMLHRSLLPNLANGVFSEYVAYVGILPLLLALLGLVRRWRRHHSLFFAVLALLGLLLALGAYNPLYYVLYRFVPGLSLFRVPARWLYLYAVGMSMLAGLGIEELVSRSRSLARPGKWQLVLALSVVAVTACLVVLDPPSPVVIVYWVAAASLGAALLYSGLRRQRGKPYLAIVVVLVVGELFLASQSQAYNRVTAPQALSSMRTSVARLLTDEGVYRFLSYSDGKFDAGDLREIQENLAPRLSAEAIYDYLVATKQKEILTPNLPVLYHLQSLDGYDGGVLPLASYVAWQSLLLPEEQISTDGRLQGRVQEIPEAWLLNLCNVKYILTDKTYDAWVDGVYYDLSHGAVLGGEGPLEMTVEDPPTFPATALGVVSHLINVEDAAQDSIVAVITITDQEGHSHYFPLRAGVDTEEGHLGASASQHGEARVVGHWRDDPSGNDYHTLLEWGEALYPQEIRVRFTADAGQFRLRGLTLIDQRTGRHQSLVVSSEGSYKLVHSGDVKIYENLDVLPRAFVVHQERIYGHDQKVLEAMLEDPFQPGEEVLLLADAPSSEPPGEGSQEQVRIVSYEPERVTIEASLGSPGYLVLTDAYYPGWRAFVNGQPTDILQADYYFRALFLPEGQHSVEFAYNPPSFRAGVAVSIVAFLCLVGALVWEQLRSWHANR